MSDIMLCTLYLVTKYLLFCPVFEPFFNMKSLGLNLNMPFEYSIIRTNNKMMVIVLKISMTLCFLRNHVQNSHETNVLQTVIFKVLPLLDDPVNGLILPL